MNARVFLELLFAVSAALFAVLYLIWPESSFGRWAALFGAIFVVLEALRRNRSGGSAVPELRLAEPGAQNFAALEKSQLPECSTASHDFKEEHVPLHEGSLSFFSRRFGYAFPGERESRTYLGSKGLDRLEVLLAQPLRYGPEARRSSPIWWWRGGNLEISDFRRVSDREALMDGQELRIKRVISSPHHDYRRLWVYVECDPSPATGLYEPYSESQKDSLTSELGGVWEEYAIYKGNLITRSEYDDGAALIGGRVVRTPGAELRSRCLTTYNFVIAAFESPVNNSDLDQELFQLMNGILQGSADFEELRAAIQALPIRSKHG